MMWGKRFGRRWMQGYNQDMPFGRRFGRGRGWCWQEIFNLAKELGEDPEKYLMDPRPGWMILQELLEKKKKKE